MVIAVDGTLEALEVQRVAHLVLIGDRIYEHLQDVDLVNV